MKRCLCIACLLLVILLTFSGVVFAQPIADADLQKLVGRTFEFRPMEKSMQKYGYMSIHASSQTMVGQRYKKLAGKRGKIAGVYRLDPADKFYWQLKLEDGKTFYTPVIRNKIEYIQDVCFDEQVAAAQKLVGQSVWVNQVEWVRTPQMAITEIAKVSYPLAHLEKVKVIGLDKKIYGHMMGSPPLLLRVQKSDGTVGMIGYRMDFFFDFDPIDPSWDPTVVAKIKSQGIDFGMTKIQVFLALGMPLEKTVQKSDSGASKEKWKYEGLTVWIDKEKVVKVKYKVQK